ncbi:MAG: hypothetical protein AB7U29_16115 [Desulfobulbus sp.]
MCIFSVFQGDQGCKRIITPIRSNQQRLLREILGLGNHPVDEISKPFLAMLAAGPQFNFQAPAFQAKIYGYGGIAIVVFIGAADTPSFLVLELSWGKTSTSKGTRPLR